MSTTINSKSRRLGIFRGDPQSAALADGALPCRACGVAVRRPTPARSESLKVPHYLSPGQAAAFRGPLPSTDVPVTRCDDCTKRREYAEALLIAHPRVARAHGHVGLDRLDAALASIDLVLGSRRSHSGRLLDDLTATDAGLHDLIEALAPIGAAASWTAQRARAGESAAKRWGHVPDSLRVDAADAQRVLVHRATEPIQRVSPPDDGARACLLCGLGHLMARESDRARAWGPLFSAHPNALNARGADPIPGYCCPACRAAIQSGGNAVSLPAAGFALLAHLGFRRTGFSTQLRVGIATPWAALRRSATPNETPWAHLDLAKITRQLDRSLGVSRIDGAGS